jgi:ketosteroid isomerase-like protein
VDTETTRALVTRMYEAYARGDRDDFADIIHDDIDWTIYGPIEVFSFAGSRKGKQAVLDALSDIAGQFELKRYVPEIVLADGARAAALSNVAFMQRSTGRILTFKIVDFMRFDDGRIIEFRELLDSFDVTQQALGRWLRV